MRVLYRIYADEARQMEKKENVNKTLKQKHIKHKHTQTQNVLLSKKKAREYVSNLNLNQERCQKHTK